MTLAELKRASFAPGHFSIAGTEYVLGLEAEVHRLERLVANLSAQIAKQDNVEVSTDAVAYACKCRAAVR